MTSAPEMIQVPRETLEAMAEALSLDVAMDQSMAPDLREAQARQALIQELVRSAERRSLAFFGNCRPLNFILALSLEIAERGTL
jgi:hypothetical protein